MNNHKVKLIVTFFYDFEKYKIRFIDIIENLPKNRILVVLTLDSDFYSKNKRVIIINLNKGLFSKSVFLSLKFVGYLFLLSSRYEIVVLDWHINFLISSFFKSFFRKKVNFIYSPVTSSYYWFYKRFKRIIPDLSRRYDYLQVKEVFFDFLYVKFSDYVLVQSKHLKDLYSKIYNINSQRVLIHYNRILENSESELENKINKEILIGYAGNLEIQKGIKDLYYIFDKIERNDLKLILAGNSRGKKNIKEFQRLKFLNNVNYIGINKFDEMSDFYGSIDALILLSYHEGSPRIISEFVSRRKPIFAYYNEGLDYCLGLSFVRFFKYGDVNAVLSELEIFNFTKHPNKDEIIIDSDLKNLLNSL
jgi:hypothetical protein